MEEYLLQQAAEAMADLASQADDDLQAVFIEAGDAFATAAEAARQVVAA